MKKHIEAIAEELKIRTNQVAATAALLDEGSTVPFIARYRKEVTDSLDEVVITSIRDTLARLRELDLRKEAILKSMEKHGHLTDELKQKVDDAPTMALLEDIYLPYKPKRRTKGTIAKEKGLEPLAFEILAQSGIDPATSAIKYVDAEKGVESVEEALSGARDIIAEIVNENPETRDKLRGLFLKKSMISSKGTEGKELEGAKYKDYFEWSELLADSPSHRVLAMRRGEKEDILNLSINPPEDEAIGILTNFFVTGKGMDSAQVVEAVEDSYKRLLSRSMETETRVWSKEKADLEAIKVFTENLRELLLAPPMGSKRLMAVDPGLRTGCKAVCLDRQGKLLHYETFYLTGSEEKKRQAAKIVCDLAERYKIEAVAIGNGTGGRETETFIKGLKNFDKISVIMVNESGASVYSASEAAREEFADLDLTIRGAVSIGRRLMDPLSELVKIDPKSIGVGQYQHDVDQSALKQSLDDVVTSCVNYVGVDLNRASTQLLTYVSGLGPRLAKNIVEHRNQNGAFQNRTDLKKVKRLGPKAFEQAAGFLRIVSEDNPLDASAVHPESYHVIKDMVKNLECSVADLIKERSLRKQIDIGSYVTDKIGLPTLKDIMDELEKPGRDPRDSFEEFSFADGIETMNDLEPDMKLPGIITNVTNFGAFVDIGVHQDGLVHISELADVFVKDPKEFVKVQQKVRVTVLDIDIDRKRISLSMKTGSQSSGKASNSADTRDQKTASGTSKKDNRQNTKVYNKGKNYKRDNKKQGPKKSDQDKSSQFNNPFADFFK